MAIDSILTALIGASLLAQEGGGGARPEPRMMRYEENWSKFKKSTDDRGPFDALKWIGLGRGVHLTLGGETRQRFELFRNDEWGLESTGFDGFFLQRYMFHADLSIGSRWRFFAQAKSGIETGRKEGPRPPDEDRFDMHQGFLEVRLSEPGSVTLRAGRQEVGLGSSRLVAIREGPNVRQSFDGARLLWRAGKWQSSILALRPVQTNRGTLDDSPDHRQSLWGLYSTRPLATGTSLDLYYLGLDRKRARFHAGSGREHRHSFGARFSYRRDGWDLDHEAVVQSGSFAGRGIRAWTVGTNTGYTFRSVRFQPRIGTKADVTSGDKDPADQKLGTFNALFPRGNYFSQADLLGPYNLMDLHPAITLKLAKNVTFTHDTDILWRYSTRDGLYNVPGVPIVPGLGSDARFVGYALKFGGEWRVNEYLSFEAEYQRLFSGRFLKDQGRGRAIDFLAVWASFKF